LGIAFGSAQPMALASFSWDFLAAYNRRLCSDWNNGQNVWRSNKHSESHATDKRLWMSTISYNSFKKIMATSKMVCVIIFLVFYFGSIFLWLIPPFNTKRYAILTPILWIVGAIPYIMHQIFIPYFIKKILKIEIESANGNAGML